MVAYCDVRMGERAAVAACSCPEADRMGLFDPFLDAVRTGLTFNYGEFAIVKVRLKTDSRMARSISV